ncbi:MAG: hypothetical protein K6E51_09020 [Treponema sp.]|nr:hypothetical protein [Treponema sp.]
MTVVKKIAGSLILISEVFAVSTAFADDGFDFGSTNDSTTIESTNADLDFGDDGFAFDAGDSFGNSAEPTVVIGGTVKLDTRAYLNDPKDDSSTDGEDTPLYATPDATLNATYQNSASEIEVKINLSKDSIKTYQEDVIEEAVARAYVGNFIIEGGKQKLVWGKGDKLHVLDNFCATDYTDFIYPDYIDRRLAVPMIHGIFNAPSGMFRAEVVYAPILVTDRYASSGYWIPGKTAALTSSLKTAGKATLATLAPANGITPTYIQQMSAANGLSFDNLNPDTNKIKYSQYGIRFTGIAGSFDWGASYYYGYYKQPSIDKTKLTAYVSDYITNAGSSNLDTGVAYDRLQVFGLEGAKAIGRFNTRFELAYNLTDDTTGDDTAVHNNSISWLPGFDVDLPIHNLNLNIQEQGTYILKNEDIDKNPSDVDYDAKGRYTNNKLVVKLSDTFLHDNLTLELAGIWGIERGDLVIMPKGTYTIKTGFDIIASGMILYAHDEYSEFYTWRNNSFAQLGVKYQF